MSPLAEREVHVGPAPNCCEIVHGDSVKGDETMASDLGRAPLLVRFLDSFLQERNIKWLLGVGVLILLSSTLLPVTMYWNRCAPASQYLILLAYVALLHGAGQWLYHKLGLRRTGTVLQG